MRAINTIGILLISAAVATAGEWQPLFEGTSLKGWKASEKPGVFTVTDAGTLKVEGGRSHLFWMGTDTIPATFNDFELSVSVKTTPGSNSGIFFHTEYQETGWPKHGYEAQVNSTHKDPRKTGSIYAVQDVMNDAPSTDDKWFTYLIRVEGKTVTISVDGEVVNQYTEPADLKPKASFKHRRLSSGTFALQGHDPKSITYYRNIKARTLK
jgi:hypothetical protein